MREVEIPLTQGRIALVDVDDLHLLLPNTWCFCQKTSEYGIAVCTSKQKRVAMHRRIMGVEDDPTIQVDHINGNPLDNRRENLRLCSGAENIRNALKARKHNKASGLLGVGWRKNRNRWIAKVRVDGRTHSAGSFKTKEEAADARDKLAKELHGEFFSPSRGKEGCAV